MSQPFLLERHQIRKMLTKVTVWSRLQDCFYKAKLIRTVKKSMQQIVGNQYVIVSLNSFTIEIFTRANTKVTTNNDANKRLIKQATARVIYGRAKINTP